MPDVEPGPAPLDGPLTTTLPAGTALHRIHSSGFPPASFNPTVLEPPRGGRFDSPDGSWPHLYAGLDVAAAVAEALLRHVPAPVDHPRLLPRVRLRDLRLSALVVTTDLELVQLHGPGLACVGQDSWLTACDGSRFGVTRRWATALRAWSPSSAGLTWRARPDNDRRSLVLFGDRVPGDALRVGMSLDVATGPGFRAVRDALRPYRVTL